MVIALLRGPGFLLRPCSGPCYFSAVFQISRAFLQLLHLAAPPLQGFTGAFAQQAEKYTGRGYVRRAEFQSKTLTTPGLHCWAHAQRVALRRGLSESTRRAMRSMHSRTAIIAGLLLAANCASGAHAQEYTT